MQPLSWVVLAIAPLINTPAYDYHPAGVAGSVYTCGAYGGGDAIYRDGSLVLSRAAEGADSRHACAPSVVVTRYAPLVTWVRALSGTNVSRAWLLYYECESVATDGHPALCVAVSHNGSRWFRWNGQGFNGRAVPIFTGSTGWYGAGHPSAMVLPDGRIRLVYYDWDGVTAYHVADSWDGLHFWPVADWQLPFPAPGPGVRVHLLSDGRYLVLGVVSNRNVYTVGDGYSWAPLHLLGESSPDRLAAPGRPSLMADERGVVALDVPTTLYSGEYDRTCGLDWWQCNSAIYAWQGLFR